MHYMCSVAFHLKHIANGVQIVVEREDLRKYLTDAQTNGSEGMASRMSS